MVEPLLVQTLRGVKNDKVPFWFMRQAGRYLPEYLELRAKAGDFLTLCFTPDWAAEVTLQPIRRYDMSAAILFSDILVIPYALGRDLRFEKGEGPLLQAVSNRAEIEGLRGQWNPGMLEPVMETVRKVRDQLQKDKALIGFCGGPWTVACYMIQGRGSRDFQEVRRFAAEKEAEFSTLIDTLVEVSAEYLCSQIEAGVNAVQVFDSWAGVVSEAEYRKWVIAPTVKLVTKVRDKYPEIPIIGFPRGGSPLMKDYVVETRVNGVGVDYTMPMEWVAKEIAPLCAIQGNLDPVLLASDSDAALEQAKRLLEQMRGKNFVFNLGHGMLPHTPVEHVQSLCELLSQA